MTACKCAIIALAGAAWILTDIALARTAGEEDSRPMPREGSCWLDSERLQPWSTAPETGLSDRWRSLVEPRLAAWEAARRALDEGSRSLEELEQRLLAEGARDVASAEGRSAWEAERRRCCALAGTYMQAEREVRQAIASELDHGLQVVTRAHAESRCEAHGSELEEERLGIARDAAERLRVLEADRRRRRESSIFSGSVPFPPPRAGERGALAGRGARGSS